VPYGTRKYIRRGFFDLSPDSLIMVKPGYGEACETSVLVSLQNNTILEIIGAVFVTLLQLQPRSNRKPISPRLCGHDVGASVCLTQIPGAFTDANYV
jgi:hypothetical protein